MTQIITPEKLKALSNVKILHVTSPQSFSEEHIKQAVSLCVYEMDFLTKAQEIIPDKESIIVLCGVSATDQSSHRAYEILSDSGYTNLQILDGGLEGWKMSGGDLEGDGISIKEPRQGLYEVDRDQSRVEWTGRNLANKHSGHLRLAGHLHVQNNLPVSGELQVDLRHNICEDIADSALNKMLIHHLSSSDFFDVEKHPVSTYRISKATTLETTPGTPNLTLDGTLSLRGQENPLSCKALAGFQGDGSWVMQAHLDFDRTLWGIHYGSGKLYQALGMHLVNDLITIQIKIIATQVAHHEQ